MLKDLHAIRGRAYIQRLIAEGEHERQDFKYAISDARKIARSISAFANRHGGRLLIGVKDNGVIAGVRNDEDLYVIEQAAQMCCVPPQPVVFKAYKTDPGIVVYVAEIAEAEQRPVYVDEGGKAGLTAYVRRADENITAHPLQVRAWEAERSGISVGGVYSEAAMALLRHTASGPLDPEQVPYLLHLSRQAAADLIVSLLTAKLLQMTYSRSGHRLTVPEAADQADNQGLDSIAGDNTPSPKA